MTLIALPSAHATTSESKKITTQTATTSRVTAAQQTALRLALARSVFDLTYPMKCRESKLRKGTRWAFEAVAIAALSYAGIWFITSEPSGSNSWRLEEFLNDKNIITGELEDWQKNTAKSLVILTAITLEYIIYKTYGYSMGTRLWKLSLARLFKEPLEMTAIAKIVAKYEPLLSSKQVASSTIEEENVLSQFSTNVCNKLVQDNLIKATLQTPEQLATLPLDQQLKNFAAFKTTNAAFYNLVGDQLGDLVNQVITLSEAQNSITHLNLAHAICLFLLCKDQSIKL